jgi:hypothetical protein
MITIIINFLIKLLQLIQLLIIITKLIIVIIEAYFNIIKLIKTVSIIINVHV